MTREAGVNGYKDPFYELAKGFGNSRKGIETVPTLPSVSGIHNNFMESTNYKQATFGETSNNGVHNDGNIRSQNLCSHISAVQENV